MNNLPKTIYGFSTPARKLCLPEKLAYAKILRKNMTLEERLLWDKLKHRQRGYYFRRQAIILGWIVDFYCPAAGLAIEIDGSIHNRPDISEKDHHKDISIMNRGIDVLRFSNGEIRNNLEEVIWIIEKTISIRRGEQITNA